MIITIACPSAPHPVGGVTALYEFGNGLARRGHEVHLFHGQFFGFRIEGLEDLAWFRFEPGVHHHIADQASRELPEADIFFGTGSAPELGLPVLLLQGADMLFPWLERAAFRTPCLKICIASWLVDVGLRFGVPPEQFRVVPMGIDHDRFRPRQPLEGRPPVVSALHHVHEAKGWATALRALEAAHRRVPELRVEVFGTTQPDDLAELPGWVRFRLNPGAEELAREVYSASRVFLQASDHEGFGFTAVEAMACGAALVTTDNGGSRDYAVDGETALVAAPRDHDALADHLVNLLTDEPTRLALASAGEAHVRRFDWDLGCAQLEGHLLAYLADPAAYQQEPGEELETPVGPWADRRDAGGAGARNRDHGA